MKTKILLLLGALASMTFLSCNKEEYPGVPEKPDQITLVLGNEPIPPAQTTKTYLAGDGITPLWDGNENLCIFYPENGKIIHSTLLLSNTDAAGKAVANLKWQGPPRGVKINSFIQLFKSVKWGSINGQDFYMPAFAGVTHYYTNNDQPLLLLSLGGSKDRLYNHLISDMIPDANMITYQNLPAIGQYDPTCDMLIGKTIEAGEITGNTVPLKLKRMSSVVKIHLIDKTSGNQLSGKKILDGHLWTTEGPSLAGERCCSLEGDPLPIDPKELQAEEFQHISPDALDYYDSNVRGVKFETKKVDQDNNRIDLDYPVSEPFLLVTFPIEKGSWEPAAELKLDVNLSGKLSIHFSKKFADANSFWVERGKLNTININVTDAMLEQQQ